jgi:hypothetical protein
MGNYVIAVGNYLIVSPSELGNYVIADSLVTAAVLHLVEQGLLLIPPDLEQRLAVQAEADDSTDHSRT